MKTFEKLLCVASLALFLWATYTLVAGLHDGVLCFKSRCAIRGETPEHFGGYVVMYGCFSAFGIASAWRSYKNLETGWVGGRGESSSVARRGKPSS